MRYALGALCGVLGAFSGRYGALAVILIVLLVGNVIDYITGVWAAAAGGKLSSAKGAKGIYKKLGIWLEVAVSFLVDILLIYGTPALSITFLSFPVICPTVALWLGLNEILSILENLGLLGVPLPEFLKKSILLIQGEIDSSLEPKKPK